MTADPRDRTPLRHLTESEIQTYRDRGVVHASQVVSSTWIDKTLALVDAQIRNPSRWGEGAQKRDHGGGRFYHDRLLWPHHPGFRDFVFNSGMAALAGEAMGSREIRAYFDHVFVKEPNTDEPFMWHQDIPYWPFRGEQICSVWLALTDCDVDSSALEFVIGTDRNGKLYKPVMPGAKEMDYDFKGDGNLKEWLGASAEEICPDFGKLRDRHEIVSFDIRAGDALIFNTRIVHSSRGNLSKTQRRVALSTRWLGDDARWDPRPGTDPIVTQDMVSVRPGDLAHDDAAFPVVWRRETASAGR